MSIRTGDRQLIKELNIALAINCIRHHEPISRVELAERIGLGRSTISGIIGTLLKEGLVHEIGSGESASGRKPVLLTFNSRALFAVGVKLGPRSAEIAMVDAKAEAAHTLEVALSPSRGPEQNLAIIKDAVEAAICAIGVPREKVLGVGLVMPGVVDPVTGMAGSSYFLGWSDFPVRDVLARELDLPVFVDNDANAMALAEALYGAGQGASDILAITVGVGIGAGVIIGGQIHRGALYGAGEIGHTCVLPDGPLCACGRKGCLEALAADIAIVRRAREAVTAGRSQFLRSMARGHADLVTREMVVDAAREGDQAAREILAETGRWLGYAVGNAVNLLSPARVVVGGEAMIEAGDLILDSLRATLAEVIYLPAPVQVVVQSAALGRKAWLQGAAALVLADAFQVPIRQDSTAMARRVGHASI